MGRSASGKSQLLKALGPGIMYAGAAIGVSHLVQSTRAGATYGFALVPIVILVHVLKYPFFEFAHRYTVATGESLLVGYRSVGRWVLVGFLLTAFGLSIPTAAVLTIVTAGMAAQMFAVNLTSMTWAVIVLVVCAVALVSGGYALLDKLMKVLMVVLAACTLLALMAAIGHGRAAPVEVEVPEVWNIAGITFLVALMGWMPTPMDASAWPSLWMLERIKQTRYRPTLREALIDFNLGYAGTLMMALMFLGLGALVMFGMGTPLADKSAPFAAQFITMYTNALGTWSRPVITAVAFIAMLSTLLTVLDASPRVLSSGCRLLWPRARKIGKASYWLTQLAMIGGALLIFQYLTTQMRTLVDFVTTLAFLSAPFFAYLNLRVVCSGTFPREMAPPKWLLVLSWAGLVFLTCFSLLFLIVRFGYT